MKRGMIVTVGVGRGVEHAIALSIRNQRPDYVIFIATNESRKTVDAVEKELKEMNTSIPAHHVEKVSDENNVYEVYSVVKGAVKWLVEQGSHLSDIVVDYTSGTKPMSAGALFSAIMTPCGSIVYVSGERDKPTGRVISGTERILVEQPNRLLAERYLNEAIRLFDSYQFMAASQLLRNILRQVPSSVEPRLDTLHRICEAYHKWDSFNHIEARAAFDRLNRHEMEEWSPQISINKGWVNIIANALESSDPRKRLCRELLVDLWMNADRRLEEGRFIDALARLYRLTELIAQYRLLHNYDIDTSNVDLNKIPQDMHETLTSKYRDDEGKIRIPLHASYQILERFKEPIVEVFRRESMRDSLARRNESIAAHGLAPVSAEHVRNLKEEVREMLEIVMPDLSEMLRRARFPRLMS